MRSSKPGIGVAASDPARKNHIEIKREMGLMAGVPIELEGERVMARRSSGGLEGVVEQYLLGTARRSA